MSGTPLPIRLALLSAACVTIAAAQPAEAPAPRERVLSPRLSAALAEKLPKFTAPAAGAARQAAPGRLPDDPAPRNSILRLPDYIVREPRVPDEEAVLTEKGRSAVAMNRYLGPSDGFDRGFLNAFTLGDLWRKIPLLGRIPVIPFASIPNEQRAMEIYEHVEQRRQWEELLRIEAIAREAAAPKTPAPTKR